MKYKVGSVQINNGFSGQYYLPFSIGLLIGYFRAHSKERDRFSFSLPLYKRLPLKTCIEHLKDSDIVLFSTYVWNEKISLSIASYLKKLNPEVLIIFGGPSVPDMPGNYLKAHPFIDIVCHQEGERTLTALLDRYPSRDYTDVSGIGYLGTQGEIHKNDSLPRMRDLNVVPSPYLEGVFDNLMQVSGHENWLASWETNRGCPFACTYCDWGSATNSKVSRMDMGKIKEELEWFATNKIEFLFLCDANFGMLPRDYEIAEMAIKAKRDFGYPHVLSVQATKNARERSYKIQKLLYEGGLHKGVNIAMQTTDPMTLKEIKRDNISLADYGELQRRFLKDKIPTYSDLIIGLPGDTYRSFKKSIQMLIESGQHIRIQFNNLSILPNAEMAQPSYLERNQIRTIKIPIVNMHGLSEEDESEIKEVQDLVIATKSMPLRSWKKTRFYANAVEFYYFNRLLQVPLLLISKYCEISFTNLFTKLAEINDTDNFPVITMLNNILKKHVNDITLGKPEFLLSTKWLNIYWPPGEFCLLTLVNNNIIEKFYREANKLFNTLVRTRKWETFIKDCINYNQKILKLPNAKTDICIETNYDILKYYENALYNKYIPLEIKKTRYTLKLNNQHKLTRKEWAQKVVWYGHRNSAYIYGTESITKDIAGHY